MCYHCPGMGQGGRAMGLEDEVTRHYATGSVLDRIEAGLRQAGLDPEAMGFDDLKPADEFHTGGFEATLALLDPLKITPRMQVVDLGCGIGGTARHIAHRYGARVTGIDLTDDFVRAGTALNARLGFGDRVSLRQGSVLDLPLEDACADLAVMLHVGMNVADKETLFHEAARVLKAGGRFALFDVMRGPNDEELVFPLPWSTVPETSHVAAPGLYRRAAFAAGLEQEAERDRSDFAMDFFARMRARVAAEGPPALGVHLMMGETAKVKLDTYLDNLSAGRVAPTEMVFRKP